MAIYISGVKGLPEQVQANKEDIKQIKEDIANIDFDAIRELEAQVGENTQDINNLENGQGVQDQAINGLGGRVTTAEGRITQLESDTRKITYNETNDETTIQGTTKIAIIKNNRIGDDDSEIKFGTNQGIELKQGTHTMNYDSDGKLYLDGVEITPAVPPIPLYQHNIMCNDNANNVAYRLSYISNTAESFTNNQKVSFTTAIRDAICSDILAVNPIPTGFTAVSVLVSAYPYESGSTFNFPQFCLITANSINCRTLDWNGNNLTIRNNVLGSTYTIEDKCVALY